MTQATILVTATIWSRPEQGIGCSLQPAPKEVNQCDTTRSDVEPAFAGYDTATCGKGGDPNIYPACHYLPLAISPPLSALRAAIPAALSLPVDTRCITPRFLGIRCGHARAARGAVPRVMPGYSPASADGTLPRAPREQGTVRDITCSGTPLLHTSYYG